ncbi:nitrate reductase molybdenum cofactor assembly chaperone [Brachybacterium sp. DNPG3]
MLARPAGRSRDLLHASGMTTPQLRACWLAVSWLLSYPDAEVRERLGQVRALADEAEPAARALLLGTVDALEARDALDLQEEYVDTFDTRRRGCLYLTYFSQGDTRRRGMALLRIKQDFRAAGVEVGSAELPDHLPLVLEFAAGHDPERGAKILRANRPGVELLRLHLEDVGSPWHGAVAALCATLPPLDADDRAAVMALAAEGPAEETVGLDGYGLDGDAGDLAGQTFASGCGSDAAAPGPVPVDLMRGRPS